MAEGQIKQKMTPENIKKLEEVFALDGTISEACFYANITTQTYYNWIKEFPDMKEQFDRLRQRPFLKARQTIVKSLDNPQYAFEYMKRKKKDEFSDRQELTGPDGEALLPKPLLNGESNGIQDNNSNKQITGAEEEA